MRALILAAGIGRRLTGDAGPIGPKALLQFAGKSLLERHLEILTNCGIADVTLIVGHGAEAIEKELRRLGRADVKREFNPRFAEGSIVSLSTGSDVLTSGAPIVLMDADVLYDRRLMRRLVETRLPDCFLLDRGIEPGDEPVKLCIRDGQIVDFHKRPRIAHDWHGESVGFFRFSPEVSLELARRSAAYVDAGQGSLEYEEAIRDMVTQSPDNRFGYEEVSDLPWTEIDFAEDVRRAREEILPLLVDQRSRRRMASSGG
jgi:choline kinase